MDIFHANSVSIIVSLAAVVLALVFYSAWKRRKDLEQLAASMGLAFSADWPEGCALENTGLDIFRLGYSRKAANRIQVQSRAGVISFFDYRYVTRGGRNSQTRTFTLALTGAAAGQHIRCEIASPSGAGASAPATPAPPSVPPSSPRRPRTPM